MNTNLYFFIDFFNGIDFLLIYCEAQRAPNTMMSVLKIGRIVSSDVLLPILIITRLQIINIM